MRTRRVCKVVILLAGFLASGSLWCQSQHKASKVKQSQTSEHRVATTKKLHMSGRHEDTGTAVALSTAASVVASLPQPSATLSPSLPTSLFDAFPGHLKPVATIVEVHSEERELETDQPEPFAAGSQEVLSTAGAYGDISRFLQTLPGVVASSDLTNDVLVRGGHPMENLFLVDGIEVPNINQLATLGTTGGFAPMIDSAAIQGITLYTGGYLARYPERLSSVTEIRTLDTANPIGRMEADVGIEGFGGLAEKAIHGGDLLVSAHHGILEMFAGALGSLPSYTNELTRYRRNSASGNRLTLLQIAGWDSFQFTPCATDMDSTSTIDSQYSGWRETTGVELQHVYSANSFAVASISDSEQTDHIHQQDQILNPADFTQLTGMACPLPAGAVQATPVYMEDSNDAFTTASYRYERSSSHFALSTGSGAWLQRPHYQIAQPIGEYSPYSLDPNRTDSTSFASGFSSGETGSYAQLTMHPIRPLELGVGGRVQTFAFGSHTSLTPRLSARYSLGERWGINVAYASYAQMPPFAYLLSYPANRSMLPMRSTHEIVGMDFNPLPSSQIRIEAYHKDYRDIPTSTEYPSVNLHDLVETLGQEFVWLPMNSGGHGKSSGIELSDFSRFNSKLTIRGSIAYSRAMFAGLDHVMRPSNFDLPWIFNLASIERIGHGYEVSSRFGYATGRPFTPFDLPDSIAQNRPIYEVSEMNALRAPYYARLDVQVNKDAIVRGHHLEIYAGVNNILNRQNFLTYAWMPRAQEDRVTVINQMPIFPNCGLRYIFR